MDENKSTMLEKKIEATLNSLNRKFEANNAVNKVLLGKILGKLNYGSVSSLQDAEFRVYSQFGDDGIIQYLVDTLDIKTKTFIEFGVENYNESNTRFLLENNNWRGLVLDGSEKNIDYIKNTANYWRHDLQAVCQFVTSENINQLISGAGFNGDIGLLHIDIDGNDYWLWEAISVVTPSIVIVEYNSLFGHERAITIPYEANFYRYDAHYSGLYAGASLKALCQLADRKGYEFIGSNSAGNNAYFIQKGISRDLQVVACDEGYVKSSFREHRDKTGKLTFTPGFEAIEQIRGMPVFNTETLEIEDF